MICCPYLVCDIDAFDNDTDVPEISLSVRKRNVYII